MKKFYNTIVKPLSLILLVIATASSCKKSSTPDPEPAPKVSNLSGTIDGKALNVSASGLSTTFYNTSGESGGALLTSAAVDANGSKMDFFVPNITSGTYTISPKLGTSSNPGNPNLKVQATTSNTSQSYISYSFSGNSYYAYSGTITIISDATQCTIKWDISFKDAAGRTFNSSGSLTVYAYTTVTKPKTEVKDPTPVTVKPTIDNLSPTTGMAGDTIAIAGTNFGTTASENAVKFNGVAATVLSATATKLMVIAPTATTGAVSVKVNNSETTSGPTFTYVQLATFTAMSPTSGKAGDAITLTGTNFSTATADNVVAFNGVAATVTAATATTLTVTAPANVATGLVTLKVRGKVIAPVAGFTPTFTVVAAPPVNPIVVGNPGQAYLLKGTYYPTIKAFDSEANIYVVDENDKLYKMSYNGVILKTFANVDFNFAGAQNYKVFGIATDKSGKVRALVNISIGNGSSINCMVTIAIDGKVTKDYNTTVANVNLSGMAFNAKGEAFILTDMLNTDDVIKLKTDGTYETYLKGGATGDFGGNGAYSFDFDGNNNMYVLTYTKGPNTSAVPTNAAIYKYDSLKVKTTILSGYTNGSQDGALATAQFKDIRSVVVSNQDLYVGDNGNFRIRKIAMRTGQVSTIAGNGKQYDPANGNQPTYAGALLGVNVFGSTGLLLNSANNVMYNFWPGQSGIQKLVLN